MRTFFQVFAQIYPGQCNRVIVHTHIFREQTSSPAKRRILCPAPSLVSFGNFHTVRRYFRTQTRAEQWAEYLRTTYTKGPARSGGQLELFQEVSE
jgi:hypothetical protein